jgi:hypothetical protein
MKQPPAKLVAHEPDDVFYVECSLPAGMTLDQYRRNRRRPMSRRARLRRLPGGSRLSVRSP